MLLHSAQGSYIPVVIEPVQYSDTGITIKHPIILDVVSDVVRVLDGENDIVYSFNNYGSYLSEAAYTGGGAWEIIDPPVLSDDYHLGMFKGEDLYLERTANMAQVEHDVKSSTTTYSGSVPYSERVAGVAVGVDSMVIYAQPSYDSVNDTIDKWYLVQSNGTTTSGTLTTKISRKDISFGYYSNNDYTACFSVQQGSMFVDMGGATYFHDLVNDLTYTLGGLPYISGDPRTTMHIADGFAYAYHSSKFIKWGLNLD